MIELTFMARIRNIKSTKMSTAELINGCKSKDSYFQKLFFERYSPIVYTTCRRYGSSSYNAKDLLQDAFIKAFDKMHQFDPQKGKPESWLNRIAINLALNEIRKRKIDTVELNSDFDIYSTDEEEIFSPNISEEEILALINRLPIGYKTVFNLYIIDGYSHKEIAEQLSISASTSKSQLFKAKKMLQKQITQVQKEKYG